MRRKTETTAKVTPANERSYEQNFCKISPLKQKKRNKLFVLNNAKLLLWLIICWYRKVFPVISSSPRLFTICPKNQAISDGM